MLNRFSRTELLLGEENMSKLAQSKIAIFGIGGVGSYVAEGLARCGIGEFILIDSDDISLTNINRQIHALETTIGQKKNINDERAHTIYQSASKSYNYRKIIYT